MKNMQGNVGCYSHMLAKLHIEGFNSRRIEGFKGVIYQKDNFYQSWTELDFRKSNFIFSSSGYFRCS